jgi:hypothetical protein
MAKRKYSYTSIHVVRENEQHKKIDKAWNSLWRNEARAKATIQAELLVAYNDGTLCDYVGETLNDSESFRSDDPVQMKRDKEAWSRKSKRLVRNQRSEGEGENRTFPFYLDTGWEKHNRFYAPEIKPTPEGYVVNPNGELTKAKDKDETTAPAITPADGTERSERDIKADNDSLRQDLNDNAKETAKDKKEIERLTALLKEKDKEIERLTMDASVMVEAIHKPGTRVTQLRNLFPKVVNS